MTYTLDPLTDAQLRIAELERANASLTTERDDYYSRLLGAARSGCFNNTTKLELHVFADQAKALLDVAVSLIAWIEAPTDDQSHTLKSLQRKAESALVPR